MLFIHFGLPCQTWSLARRFDGEGPGPLRNDSDFLWGFKNLLQHDLEKVRIANDLFFRTLRLIKIANDHNVPWTLENPKTSRVWLVPQVRNLVEHGASFFAADFCQYKMPWRKATLFLASGLPGLACLKTCSGSFGLCSATKKRHIVLQGRDASGTFLTHRAQPYPLDLCNIIARVVTSHLGN